MIEIIAYVAIAYLAFQFLVVLVNLITHPVLKGFPARQKTGDNLRNGISVLIPARNEALNIGALLDDLRAIDVCIEEILVYDDDSIDQTAEIVRERSNIDSRIRYIRGGGLMEGWLGKNHACHCLAKEAVGDYLLFLDADVRVEPGGIEDALASLKEFRLDLLSLFPVQEMKTFGEWITVPLMNKILLGNLPMAFIRKVRLRDFAAANGQFMLFRAEIYKRYWFHEALKKERVEDIRIIRQMKEQGYRVHTLLSGGQVHCRMYAGYREALKGFAKNVNAFFGNNWLILNIYMFLTTLGPFAVWIAFSLKALLLYLSLLIVTRIMISLLSRQNPILNVLLMPVQQITLIILTATAAWREMTGRMEWKGRRV